METKIEKLPKSKIKIEIKMGEEEFSPYLAMGSKEASKNIQIPGFRAGKAPQKLVEEKIGKNKILEEAANIALNKIFPKIIEEKKLKVLGYPEAKVNFPELQEKGDFSAEIEISLFPELKLPDWKKIIKEEEKKEVKVENKEINDAISWLQKSRAKYTRKITEALKGDQVNVDYEIRNNGVKIENGEVKDQKIVLGEEKLLPEFEKNLIGAKEGEEKNFSLKCPENFWKEDLKGKMLDFRVKIRGIFKIELPEINDDFSKSLGEFKNLKELKENVSKGIETEKKETEKRRWENAILEKISQQAEVDIPDILIQEQRDQMMAEFKKTVEEQMGISFENHLLNLKKTKEDIEKELLGEAEKKVRKLLCIYEIADKEKIKAEDKEVEKELEQIIQRYPQMMESVQSGEQREKFKSFVKEKIIEKKVLELLAKI